MVYGSWFLVFVKKQSKYKEKESVLRSVEVKRKRVQAVEYEIATPTFGRLAKTGGGGASQRYEEEGIRNEKSIMLIKNI